MEMRNRSEEEGVELYAHKSPPLSTGERVWTCVKEAATYLPLLIGCGLVGAGARYSLGQLQTSECLSDHVMDTCDSRRSSELSISSSIRSDSMIAEGWTSGVESSTGGDNDLSRRFHRHVKASDDVNFDPNVEIRRRHPASKATNHLVRNLKTKERKAVKKLFQTVSCREVKNADLRKEFQRLSKSDWRIMVERLFHRSQEDALKKRPQMTLTKKLSRDMGDIVPTSNGYIYLDHVAGHLQKIALDDLFPSKEKSAEPRILESLLGACPTDTFIENQNDRPLTVFEKPSHLETHILGMDEKIGHLPRFYEGQEKRRYIDKSIADRLIATMKAYDLLIKKIWRGHKPGQSGSLSDSDWMQIAEATRKWRLNPTSGVGDTQSIGEVTWMCSEQDGVATMYGGPGPDANTPFTCSEHGEVATIIAEADKAYPAWGGKGAQEWTRFTAEKLMEEMTRIELAVLMHECQLNQSPPEAGTLENVPAGGCRQILGEFENCLTRLQTTRSKFMYGILQSADDHASSSTANGEPFDLALASKIGRKVEQMKMRMNLLKNQVEDPSASVCDPKYDIPDWSHLLLVDSVSDIPASNEEAEKFHKTVAIFPSIYPEFPCGTKKGRPGCPHLSNGAATWRHLAHRTYKKVTSTTSDFSHQIAGTNIADLLQALEKMYPNFRDSKHIDKTNWLRGVAHGLRIFAVAAESAATDVNCIIEPLEGMALPEDSAKAARILQDFYRESACTSSVFEIPTRSNGKVAELFNYYYKAIAGPDGWALGQKLPAVPVTFWSRDEQDRFISCLRPRKELQSGLKSSNKDHQMFMKTLDVLHELIEKTNCPESKSCSVDSFVTLDWQSLGASLLTRSVPPGEATNYIDLIIREQADPHDSKLKKITTLVDVLAASWWKVTCELYAKNWQLRPQKSAGFADRLDHLETSLETLRSYCQDKLPTAKETQGSDLDYLGWFEDVQSELKNLGLA